MMVLRCGVIALACGGRLPQAIYGAAVLWCRFFTLVRSRRRGWERGAATCSS